MALWKTPGPSPEFSHHTPDRDKKTCRLGRTGWTLWCCCAEGAGLSFGSVRSATGGSRIAPSAVENSLENNHFGELGGGTNPRVRVAVTTPRASDGIGKECRK